MSFPSQQQNVNHYELTSVGKERQSERKLRSGSRAPTLNYDLRFELSILSNERYLEQPLDAFPA